MKAAKAKKASTSHKTETPFFQKEYGGHFFAKDTAPDLFFPSANNPIQPKLTIGAPDDKYEKEADAVADEVVQKTEEEKIQKKQINHSQSNQDRSDDIIKNETNHITKNLTSNNTATKSNTLNTKGLNSKTPVITPLIQTKCASCEEEDRLQKKEDDLNGSTSETNVKPRFTDQKDQLQKKESASVVGQTLHQSKGNGVALSNTVRSEMEQSFHEDFKDVSVHTDGPAIAMNQSLRAQAFTHGNDIYFNRGKFNPTERKGKHLLAHELTHVVQQKSMYSNNAVQRSVTDSIPETKNQFYAHGAFMGAAPQLMADKKWNRILEVLMPDVHTDATRALRKGPNSQELILMFENNPVMGAYGMYQTRQMDITREGGRSDRISKMQAMEWDVFLPTTIVEKYHKAPTEAEKARLAHDMVNEMLIAHGTASQTVRENVLGIRQYDNVKGTRKSEQGGVRPGAWMDLFGRALQLATDPHWERKANEYEDPDLHPRVNNPADQAAHQTFKNQLSFREVIDLYKSMFGKETFSVLLDIKSRDASPMILTALIRDLNLRGVLVYGVGTFKHSEIAGLGRMTQTVDGRTYTGPKEIKFFHLAGDLQKACLKNEISDGDTVMFNAGSLISYSSFATGPQTKASYKIKSQVVDQLRIYKKHYGFHLGVYVQENDIDDRAATLITELTNSEPGIFDLGFAWGGLSGETASDIEPTWSHATVGIYNQGWAGSDWDTRKPAPGHMATGHGFRSTISMRHRFLQSRTFEVTSGTVNVFCDAAWSDPSCMPQTYFMTLTKQESYWFDDGKGSIGFPVGRSFSATWSGLEPGDYYLQIWFPTDHDPRCELSGDIVVNH